MSELENRLAGLIGLPVAPLPGAEAARLRGEQRTRRTRAGLAGAGALVAVLALSAGVALGGGGADRVAPPPAGPGPSADAEAGLSASLLDAEDVAAVRPDEEWEMRPTYDAPFDPLPSGCADPAEVFGTPVEGALRFLDGPETIDGTETVGHSLRAYAAEDEAQAALERVVQSIRTCGETSDAPRIVAGEPASTATRTYGTLSAGTRTVVFAIERIGAVLSGVAIRSFELNDIPPLADAAAAEVAGGAYSAPATEAPVAEPGPGLLRPEDVATVEPGEWTAMDLHRDRPTFGVCGADLEPEPVEIIGVDLRVEREAGGSFIYQELYRYESVEQAAQALAAHQRAVQACPSEPIVPGDQDELDPGMRGTTSYEVVRTAPGLLVMGSNSQCETCPPSYGFSVAVQVGTRLTAFALAAAEDGGLSLGLALQYAELAEQRLREAG